MIRSAWLAILLVCCGPGVSPGVGTDGLEGSETDDLVSEAVDEHAASAACPWTEIDAEPEPADAPSSAECRPGPSAERTRELEHALNDDWRWTYPEHRQMDVTFACDRLSELATVILESSSGHGGGLSLTRLQRREDGDWALTRIVYSHYRGARIAPDPDDHWTANVGASPVVAVGSAPNRAVAPLLRRMREALSLRVRELPPPPSGTSFGGLGLSSSSASSHTSIQLTDEAGFASSFLFTGSLGFGEEQQRQLALNFAVAELRDLTTWTEVEQSDPAGHSLFRTAFAAAARRGDDFGTWYVRERYLALAEVLGDAAQMPVLLRQLTNVESEHSEERSKIIALRSIAAITGFDRRYDGDGNPRPVQEVVDEVRNACGH